MGTHCRPSRCPRAVRGATALLGCIGALLPATATAVAEEKESAAAVELGAVGDWSLNGDVPSLGPLAGVEFTPIKDWLEIESSVSAQFGHGQTEWGADLMFKKPFDLSPTIEFEPGIGPQWMHTTGGGRSADAIAAEAELDFQFWSSREHRFGWFVEPSYSISLTAGHEQALGVTVGLLIAIP